MEVGSNISPMEHRFWERVQIGAPDECWEWAAGRNPVSGYGQFGFRGKTHSAHRLSWQLSCGEIPAGSFVLHSCDNKPCVNPGHLYLGDQSQNMMDMWSRQRPKKISDEQVHEIRLRAANGELYKDLAIDFGVYQSHIGRIVRFEQRAS